MNRFLATAAAVLMASPAFAQGGSLDDEAYSVCRQYSSHKVLYQQGRLIALTVNEAVAKGFGGVTGPRIKKLLLTKRRDFPSVAAVYQQHLGQKVIASCTMAMSNHFDQPWSSVHSGLTDYLTPSLKAYFFSLPEH